MLDLRCPRRSPDGACRGSGFEVGGKQLALVTHDGMRVAPTDFACAIPRPRKGASGGGNSLPTAWISMRWRSSSAYLPLDDGTRRRLAELMRPRQAVRPKPRWSGPGDAAVSYGIDARFDKSGHEPAR